MRISRAILSLAVLCTLFAQGFCSYADNQCAIVSIQDDTGIVHRFSGRTAAWSRPVENEEEFANAIYGTDDLVCGNTSAPEFTGRYVIVDAQPCKTGMFKRDPDLKGYYDKAKRIQRMGGIGMIVICPDNEKICQKFGQDYKFEDFDGGTVDIEVVSTGISKNLLDELREKPMDSSVYNPPIPLITSSTFVLSFLVLVVIVVASVWTMPEPPEAGDKEFGITTIFIYCYAIFLSFKHGYKASDMLKRDDTSSSVPIGSSDSAELLPETSGAAVGSSASVAGVSQSLGTQKSQLPLYICMFCTMSTILLLVFFFRAYFIGFIIFMFAVGGSLSLSRLIQSITFSYAPHLFDKKVTYTLLREEEFRVMSWVFSIVCLIIGISWFSYREETWNVVMHDIFSASICVGFLHQMYVPNMRVMGIVYCCGIMYDVFWTFITPALFGSSVMVQVATGESNAESCMDIGVILPLARTTNVFKSLPFLLEMPRPCDDWSCARSSVVGLGDILIPGLMLVFCAKIKASSNRIKISKSSRYVFGNIYFFTGLLAYIIGLIWTFCSYVIMQGHGQPALMFILPSMYFFVSAVAFARGEFQYLWKGGAGDDATASYRSQLDDGATQELEPLEEGLLEEATPIL